MSNYIVCQKKRNNPRVDIRVCQIKCNLKDDCKEYISFHKIMPQDEDTTLSIKSHPEVLGAP